MLCAVCSGVKIDSCGSQKNMTLYAELFNATGKPIVTENCHQGQNFTDGGDPGQMGPGWCPYNFFRTSGDIINISAARISCCRCADASCSARSVMHSLC